MSVELASNHVLLKVANRMAIVRRLCDSPGLSRAELSASLGLTRSTVTILARELLAEGWLMEEGAVTTGDKGRRPTPLFIDPRRMLLLGAEVGLGTLRVVAASLSGELHERQSFRFDAGADPQHGLDVLARALLTVFGRMHAPGRRAIGIGVGLPGGVDEARGLLQFAPNLGWRAVPVGRLLLTRLSGTLLSDVPLFVQNEADVAAVGEIEFNASEAGDPLLFLSINRGLGAGVVVRDKLVTGSRGFAGEVGHMVLQADGPRCSCGRRGCAEVLICGQARPGDARAIGKAGQHLGVLLQNLAAAYDPGCIVLGGERVNGSSVLLQRAQHALQRYAAAAGIPPPPVRASRFGADAVAVGAAALARYRLIRRLAGVASVIPAPKRRPPMPMDRFQRARPLP